jgi:hypothetical protein
MMGSCARASLQDGTDEDNAIVINQLKRDDVKRMTS